MSAAEKTLLVFDFDHTVVDGNTDTHVLSIYPNQLPPEISDLYSRSGWTEYMAAIFDLLHSNDVSVKEIREKLFELPLTSGMSQLFDYLRTFPDLYESVIISDSNTLFIEWLVGKYDIQSAIDKIYSNPAYMDHEGRLRIDYFHKQDWCNLSSKNMCKGHIMEDHVKQKRKDGVTYKRIIYIGDGHNDLCPSLRLATDDLIFPRENYSLIRQIREQPNQIKARVVPWSCASTILNHL